MKKKVVLLTAFSALLVTSCNTQGGQPKLTEIQNPSFQSIYSIKRGGTLELHKYADGNDVKFYSGNNDYPRLMGQYKAVLFGGIGTDIFTVVSYDGRDMTNEFSWLKDLNELPTRIDDARIAFGASVESNRGQGAGLYILDIKSGQSTYRKPDDFGAHNASAIDPIGLSADSRSVYLRESPYEGRSSLLARMSVHTNEVHPIFSNHENIDSYAILPEKDLAVAIRGNLDPEAGLDGQFISPSTLYKYDLKTGSSTELFSTTGSTIISRVWLSPDGAKIFFRIATVGKRTSEGGYISYPMIDGSIYAVDESGVARELGFYTVEGISSDGNKLLVSPQSKYYGNRKFFMLTVDTREVTPIFENIDNIHILDCPSGGWDCLY